MTKVLRNAEGNRFVFFCPGCKDGHVINDRWQFNGDYERPTVTPSILVTYRHPKGFSNENPAPLGYNGEYVEDRCHSYITDGKIQFLDDSTHDLKGQTVSLEEMKI